MKTLVSHLFTRTNSVNILNFDYEILVDFILIFALNINLQA